MAKCRLYFVRHGQSEGNLHHQFLGHTDLPLTDLGHVQAQLAGEYLADKNIDIIYASDLKRAWQTAEHISEKLGLSIIADGKLREIYAGDWEGLEFEKLEAQYRDDFMKWREDIGYSRCTNGESFIEIYSRITAEVTRLAQECDGMTVCIATHATPIRCMRLLSMGLGFEKAKDIGWTSNASITAIDYSDGKFSIAIDDYNDHLGQLSTKLPKNV